MVCNDPSNEVKDGEADPPPNKIVRFELNIKSNLAEYANTFIDNFTPTQTVIKRILVKNPVSTNIKSPSLYFQELMVEQNKRIPQVKTNHCSTFSKKLLLLTNHCVKYGLP